MPAIYHEGSWLGNATDPEVLVKDTVGWTGKNLLKNTATNKTGGNVAWVVNADKSITINTSESASSVQTLYIGEVTGLQGDYILNGVTGGSLSTYGIQLYDVTTSTWLTQYAVDGDSTINLADKNHTYRFVAYVRQGVSVSNITIYPMLRRADITDPTYEPYHESVEEVVEQIYADNGVLGAKNLLQITATSQTMKGVTFTNNADGSISTSGIANNNIAGDFFVNAKINLKAGSYYVSGNPSGITGNFYGLRISDTRYDPINVFFEQGKIITFNNDIQDLRVDLRIPSGQNVNNLTFKPMIRLASDPDDTYVPYAMTNRELTEAKNDLINHYPDYAWNAEKALTTNGIDLNNITTAGLYKCKSGSIAATFNHCPVNTAFGLEVIKGNSDNTFIIQIIKYVPSAAAMYMRTLTGGSWSSWYKFTGTVVS